MFCSFAGWAYTLWSWWVAGIGGRYGWRVADNWWQELCPSAKGEEEMRVREAYSWVEDRGKVVRTEARGTCEKVPWGLVYISAYESGSGKRVLAIWGERVTWSFEHMHLGQWVFSVCCLQLLATEHRAWQCRNGLAASASHSLSRGSQPGMKRKGDRPDTLIV